MQIDANARLLINGKSPFDLGIDEGVIQDILDGSWKEALSDYTISEKEFPEPFKKQL